MWNINLNSTNAIVRFFDSTDFPWYNRNSPMSLSTSRFGDPIAPGRLVDQCDLLQSRAYPTWCYCGQETWPGGKNEMVDLLTLMLFIFLKQFCQTKIHGMALMEPGYLGEMLSWNQGIQMMPMNWGGAL